MPKIVRTDRKITAKRFIDSPCREGYREKPSRGKERLSGVSVDAPNPNARRHQEEERRQIHRAPPKYALECIGLKKERRGKKSESGERSEPKRPLKENRQDQPAIE